MSDEVRRVFANLLKHLVHICEHCTVKVSVTILGKAVNESSL